MLKDKENTQLKSKAADLMEAVKVKKLMVASLEVKKKQLKTRIAMGQRHSTKADNTIIIIIMYTNYQAVIQFNFSTHAAPPIPSTETITFLTNLVDFQ